MIIEPVFLDSDVVIDFLIDREPFSESVFALFELVEAKRLEACDPVFSTAPIVILRRITAAAPSMPS